MNHRNRTVCFVLLFATVASHMAGRGYGPLAWGLVVAQYLLSPQLLYFLAHRARDQKQAELRNMAVDGLLFGICAAGLGFPLWLTFILFIGASVNLTVFRGPLGFVEALAVMALGALATWGLTGVPVSTDTGPLTTSLAILCVSLYLWIVAHGAYVRASQLHQAREQLRAGEQALQEANHVLRLQNEAKTRFLAYAGHDLRQPLQAIHLFHSSLLKSGLNERQHHLTDMIGQSAKALTDLLDSLLDISKLDAGAVQPRPRLADAAAVLEPLILEFDPQARLKGLRLKFWHPAGPVPIRTDTRLLASIVRNLLSNALKYTARGGVMVAIRRRGADACIQVWDTGVGISASDQQYVFDEFYQVNNPQRDREKGLGLGLSIVRRLVALLGLSLHCRSRPGRGTVMELVLPLAQGSPQAVVEGDESPQAVANLDGQSVVVVEDALEVAQALGVWLEAQGARVRCFVSAEEALASDTIDAADVFLSDFRLPGAMNGIEFLDAVRARRGQPLCAALLTGDTSARFIETATASGWPVVYKPVDAQRLLEALAEQPPSRLAA